MKEILTLLACLSFLGIARSDVAEIENQFRAAYELHVGQKYEASVAALDANYLGALERAMQSATQGGKLEEALVFQDEIQRIKEKGPLPEKDDGVAPSLLKLRTTYRDQFNKLIAARKTVLAPIVEKFDAALAAHQEELTKTEKLLEAVAVKTYREGDLSQRLTGDALAISLTATSVTPDKPFENRLGMRFVPVPIIGGPSAGKAVRFSVWETRVKDYAEFVKDENREWRKPDFAQTDDHPAVNVSWDDATAFCEWLTKEERRKRKIGPKDVYRLPSDHEWSCAAGIGADEDPAATPAAKSGIVKGFPWGAELIPPKGSGNYTGVKPESDDNFEWTAPVGTFVASSMGLYDLGGNAREWCNDQQDSIRGVLRGGSWRVVHRTSTREFDLRGAGVDVSGFRVVLEAEQDR